MKRVFAQWSSWLVGAASTNGLLVGIDEQRAIINQQERYPLRFLTANTPRLQIYDDPATTTNIGFVGIGDYTIFDPQHLLHQDAGDLER